MLSSLEFTVSEQLGSLQFSLEHSLAYAAKTSLKRKNFPENIYELFPD